MASQAMRSSGTANARSRHMAPAATLTPQYTQDWKNVSRVDAPSPKAHVSGVCEHAKASERAKRPRPCSDRG